MAFDPPTLPSHQPPWGQFQIWWQQMVENLSAQFGDIEAAQTAILAAQTDILNAQADATAAAREAARINSYTNPGNVLSASDAGASTTITIADHVRVYPVQGAIDVPDVSVLGADITGLAYSTKYYVYYDDVDLFDPDPGYQVTTVAADAQVGAAAGRHSLGYITTPAPAAPPTSGSGVGVPGGTGGGSSDGTALP